MSGDNRNTTGSTSSYTGLPSYEGGEGTFNPENFGRTLGRDLAIAHTGGPQVFDQSLYSPIGQETQGLVQGGLGALFPVASGSWLNGGNPYFEQNLQKTLGDVTTGVNSTFNGSGRFGGLSHQQSLASSLGDISNQARGANFENEYARMLGAQNQGLGLSNVLDQDAQAQLTGNYDLFRRQNDADINHVARTLSVLQGGMQEPAIQQGENKFNNFLGTALGIGGLFL